METISTKPNVNSSKVCKENCNLYTLKIKLNGKTTELQTDDLKSAIMSVKPPLALKTKLFLSVEKDGKKCDRVVMVPRAKILFRNEAYLDLFIKQLIFK